MYVKIYIFLALSTYRPITIWTLIQHSCHDHDYPFIVVRCCKFSITD